MKKFLTISPIIFTLLVNIVFWAATYFLYVESNGDKEVYWDWAVASGFVSGLSPFAIAVWVGLAVYNGLTDENS